MAIVVDLAYIKLIVLRHINNRHIYSNYISSTAQAMDEVTLKTPIS